MVEFCQWSRTVCQLMLVGLAGYLYIKERPSMRKLMHRLGEKEVEIIMRKKPLRPLSLESTYIKAKVRRKVLKRDGYKCVWCGEPEEHDVGHFIQKRVGGETSHYNLVTTCKNCKGKRHYDTPREFIAKLVLEKSDVFKDMGMVKLEVTKKDDTVIKGFVNSRPNVNFKGFWITHDGNGEQELILREEVKGIRVLEGEEKK